MRKLSRSIKFEVCTKLGLVIFYDFMFFKCIFDKQTVKIIAAISRTSQIKRER